MVQSATPSVKADPVSSHPFRGDEPVVALYGVRSMTPFMPAS